MLTKNNFLAEMMCLFGLQEYILVTKSKAKHDADMFIKYSFKKTLKMNSGEVEPYEAPKILGDVFEAIIGAIFKDGGIEEIIRVLKTLMAPFVLYVAKYSKYINKEPKEDFYQLASQLKIKPRFEPYECKKCVKISEVAGNYISPDLDDEFNKVDIIFNNGQVMTSAYGNTKH